MDYFGINCPVCDKTFEQGDDVVVCPECGTPHHRECYESLNHCVNQDKHCDDFVYEIPKEENQEENNTEPTEGQSNENIIVCPRCKAENPKDTFYCGKCGFPVGIQQNNNDNQPFGMPVMVFDPFDPMGGVNPDTDMGDEVTAGEMSKYAQKNTAYFSRVFNQIKKLNKGKFSFCGFLFSGGYLLYRKMYKIGSVITGIMLALMLLDTYIYFTPAYQDVANVINEVMQNTTGFSYMNAVMEATNSLNAEALMVMSVINISAFIQFAIRILTGIMANRWYFKHCKNKIISIKKNNSETASSELETKGGVNMPIAVSLFVVYMIISYLPTILLSLNIF